MKMFQDDKGNMSSTRVVWSIGMLIVMGVWAYLSISTGEMVHITVGDATGLGMLLGMKAGTKIIENRKET